MAITTARLGTAVTGANVGLTPPIPAGTLAGELVLGAFCSRGGGTHGFPAGWDVLYNQEGRAASAYKWSLCSKSFVGGDANPAFTYTGGASTHDVIAQCVTLPGADTVAASLIYATGGRVESAASTVNIGPLTGCDSPAGGAVIVMGFQGNDWTSVATLSGDGLTWVEIGEPDSIAGSDAGFVWDYALTPSLTTVTAKTFTVTGAGQNWFGRIFSINPAAGGVTDATVVVGTGSATAAGTAASPVVSADATVAVGTGSATAEGTAVASAASSAVQVGTGAATASGAAASPQASSTAVVGTGTATASGTAATPSSGAGATVAVGTGTADASGTAVSPQVSSAVAVGMGNAAAAGTPVATRSSSTIAVGTGSASASGTAAAPVAVDGGDATVVVGTGSATAEGTEATPVITPDVPPPAPGPTGGRYEPGGDETSIYPVDATVRVGTGSAVASGTRATPRAMSPPRFRLPLRRPRVMTDASVRVGAASAVATGLPVACRVAAAVGVGTARAAGLSARPVRSIRVEDADRMVEEAVAAVLLLSED